MMSTGQCVYQPCLFKMWKQVAAVACKEPVFQSREFSAKVFGVQILHQTAFVRWENVLEKPHFWKQRKTKISLQVILPDVTNTLKDSGIFGCHIIW